MRSKPVQGNPPRLVDRVEDRAIRDFRLRRPGLQCACNPERDWDGSNMAALADEIRGHPVFFPLLQILNTERGHFCAM